MAVAQGDQRRKKEALDLLASEVAKGDEEALVHSLRTALEKGWVREFSDCLLEAKKKKDSEIDRTCSRHYTDFLNSIEQLLSLRSTSQELTSQVVNVQHSIQATGGNLIHILNALETAQIERQNVLETLETVLLYKEIARLMNRIKELILVKQDYHIAMRMIEILSQYLQDHNPKLATGTCMRTILDSWLPSMIEELLRRVREESNTFLSQLRLQCGLMGHTILLRQAKISSYTSTTLTMVASSAVNTTPTAPAPTPSSASLQQTPTDGRRQTLSFEEFQKRKQVSSVSSSPQVSPTPATNLNPSVGSFASIIPSQLSISLKQLVMILPSLTIDHRLPNDLHFANYVPPIYSEEESLQGARLVDYHVGEMAPLHKVLHLSAILGDITEYHNYYQSERLSAFQRLIKHLERTINSGKSLYDALLEFLDELIGLCFLERVIARMVEIRNVPVFAREELEKIWSASIRSMTTMALDVAITLRSPESLIHVKELLLLATHVANDELFSFETTTLLTAIDGLWDTFDALQVQGLVQSIDKALNRAAYQPLYVASIDAWNQLVLPYHLERVNLNVQHFSRFSTAARSKANNATANTIAIAQTEANIDRLEEELGISTSTFSPPPSAAKGAPNRRTSIGSTTSTTTFSHQTMPFSEFVPAMISELHSGLLRLCMFCVVRLPSTDDRRTSSTLASAIAHGGEARIVQSVLALFTQLSKTMEFELARDGSETALSKVAQLYIDATVLSFASDELFGVLEETLTALAATVTDEDDRLMRRRQEIEISVSRLADDCTRLLDSVATDSRAVIFELLTAKVDNLLESLVFMDLEPPSLPPGVTVSIYGTPHPALVHESVSSAIDFLGVTFMWLNHLPDAMREAVHCLCCQRLANGILEFLLSPAVQRINIYGLICLEADCRSLIEFSDKALVVDLSRCFDELHSLLRAILMPQFHTLADNPKFLQEAFPKIDINKFVLLVEKINPVSQNFPEFARLDRNTLKNVLRKVRTLISQ